MTKSQFRGVMAVLLVALGIAIVFKMFNVSPLWAVFILLIGFGLW